MAGDCRLARRTASRLLPLARLTGSIWLSIWRLSVLREREALDEIERWNPAIVIPGHGVQGNIEAIHGQRAYVAAVIEGVRSALARGETL
jgi:hypothetical protein